MSGGGWLRATVDTGDALADARTMSAAQERFEAIVNAHLPATSWMLFEWPSRPRPREPVYLYLSPVAARWATSVLPSGAWEACGPPPEGAAFLVGDTHAAARLLGRGRTTTPAGEV